MLTINELSIYSFLGNLQREAIAIRTLFLEDLVFQRRERSKEEREVSNALA
jgi:hypothetical protein